MPPRNAAASLRNSSGPKQATRSTSSAAESWGTASRRRAAAAIAAAVMNANHPSNSRPKAREIVLNMPVSCAWRTASACPSSMLLTAIPGPAVRGGCGGGFARCAVVR